MAASEQLVKPHNHSIADLPVGKGPGKIPSWEDIAYEQAVEVIVPAGGGSFQMGTYDELALVDTTLGDAIGYMPPLVATGQQVTVRITAGTNAVQVTPKEATVGVNGTPGATFLIDPQDGLVGASFVGDLVNNVWWLVTATPVV